MPESAKEQAVSFNSAGLRLHGVLGVPDDLRASERRAAFLVLHGFGSNSDSTNVLQPTRVLNDFGYVTLRFDMRGCGKSEGEFGRVICLEQVEGEPGLGVLAENGERKFRGQHRTPEAWARFSKMLEEGRAYRGRTGKSLMVPRYDIVPIPDHVRENLERQKVGMLAPNSVEMFPAETAQSMFDFRAEEVVEKIAPRPLLLIHAANDSVTPTEQSIELFKHAGQPTELHLFSGLDHFLFAENSTRVWTVLRNWLDAYFPARRRRP